MSERSILAYFKTPEEAESVSRKLKSLRVIDMSIDRFSKYPGGSTYHNINPRTGNFESLANLTLNASVDSRSAGILAAADTGASGMSDGGDGGPTGRDILLTVVLDEASFHPALRLIEEAGGVL
ncbi:hypothetical protein ACE6ED_17715 [Paenibacillus sp. CN-4]|uniref:hypothetical protein n=1 Tax=Paenibacillus nanchangensis TaxID=3348343 RepID=UPI00397BF7A4